MVRICKKCSHPKSWHLTKSCKFEELHSGWYRWIKCDCDGFEELERTGSSVSSGGVGVQTKAKEVNKK